MRTEQDVRAYEHNLTQAETQLEAEVQRHAQLHLLYPDAGHERSRSQTERRLLAIRAKLALVEWLLESEGYIPKD